MAPPGRPRRTDKNIYPPKMKLFYFVQAYVVRHPLLSLEHITLLVLALLYLSSSGALSSTSKKMSLVPSYSWAAFDEGPERVLNLEGVVPAPMPTMGKDKLNASGQLGEGIIVNMMRTVPGTMRSGDVHNCTQFDVILKGKTRLRLKNLATGEEVTQEYSGQHDYIAIPPRVAHLFEFVEENYMIEWWACDFKSWYYKPYRDIIDSSLKG
eukprot:jgi/Mesen1/475/ME000101S10698